MLFISFNKLNKKSLYSQSGFNEAGLLEDFMFRDLISITSHSFLAVVMIFYLYFILYEDISADTIHIHDAIIFFQVPYLYSELSVVSI